MNREEKKDYLKEYHNASARMELDESMEKDYTLIQKDLEKRMRASSLDVSRLRQMEELLDDIKCFRKKILNDYKECKRKAAEIRNVISSVQDDREGDILRMRYIESMKVEEIAEKMSYCRESICRIHNQALDHLKL
ncbi:MAG: DUF1492 domain-containing protein [Eubacterium sp.]|jgi:Sigma-70, region 4.|uniref:sigma factor-like helix-turn-helix DNA-binding protein n=1 Tax=Parablautia intestinalis TaxID=2320100 RepID=UPI0021729C36|nr:sigma factor-like helix-turn-helix DNA-binding protein [Parablautia intestinalis]MCI9539050.1 DUF1492 domain-containing protein [Eubacterium sp.]